MSKTPLIIHHQGCSDGICGAYILWLGLGKDADLLAAQYGDNPPPDEDLKGRSVWIVDFSYPREVLTRMNAVVDSLIILDHHETAQENCEGFDFATFDMDRSGAMLAYDYVDQISGWSSLSDQLQNNLLLLARYVQDRDLWQWKLNNSKQMNCWLASYPRTLSSWQNIFRLLTQGEKGGGWESAMREGNAILRQNGMYTQSMVGNAWKGTTTILEDRPVVAAITNSTVLHSEVGEALAEEDGVDMGVAWTQLPDGVYTYSLRSRAPEGVTGAEAFDTAEVATAFGGGGHREASAFTSEKLPQELFTKESEDSATE